MTIEQLNLEIAQRKERLTAISANVENNTATPEERAELRTLVSEIDTFVADLEAAERAKEILKDKAAKRFAKTPEEEKVVKRFSMLKAIRHQIDGSNVDGVEAEMHQEALKEAREAGISGIQGQGIPSFLSRGLDADTAATAKNLIATDLGELVPALYPALYLQTLGATVLTGLRGDLDIPVGANIATASFETETGDADETTPSTAKRVLTPRRLAAWTDFTLKLLYQSSVSVENWVVSELVSAEARKVEQVAILGGGTNEPSGILVNADVNTIPIAANGGQLTRQLLLAMETAIEDANADMNPLAFLSTPRVKEFLKNLQEAAGSGQGFVWKDDNTVIGHNAYKSNLVPKTLTKGSGTNLHAAILGDFSRLVIGNWGVRDLVVDNITKKKQGKIEVVMNSFWDVAITQPKAFSVIKDISF